MRPIFALLAVSIWMAAASLASAQNSDSHLPIENWGGGTGVARPKALADQLSSRMGKRPPAKAMETDLAKQLVEMFQKDPKKWTEFLKSHPDLEKAARAQLNDPKQVEKLREQLKNLSPDLVRLPAPDNGNRLDQNLGRLQDFMRHRPPPELQSTLPPITADAPGRITPPVPTGPDGPKASNGTTPPSVRHPDLPLPRSTSPRTGEAGMRDFAKSMEKWWPKSMGDSPAMKKLGSELGNKDWNKIADSTFGKTGKAPNINWDKVGSHLKGTGRFLDRNLPTVSGRSLPNMPRVTAPTLPSGPSLPSLGAPPTGGIAMGGSTFTALVLLASVLIGGFLLWRLIIRPMQLANQGANLEADIGPWPVDPTRIKTRAELVKAFDYLALRSCGKPARLWHHREVANQLGADDIHRRQTAGHLAETYAHARYAPPAEPLDEPTAIRARNDICALAGEAAP